MAAKRPSFGVELVSLYDPGFWNVKDRKEMIAKAASDPRWFWDRVLDTVQRTGADGLEICFPPATWEGAVAGYGSEEGFVAALDDYKLTLISGFFDAPADLSDAILDAGTQREILDQGAQHARFLAQCGGHVLVSGMPVLKRSLGDQRQFLDLDYARRVADLMNRLGAVVRGEGIELALHTEVGSVFCTRREIDLFLLLTDQEYVGFCPDTGQIILGGSNPIDILNDHYDRVNITHWKDATGRFVRPAHEDENLHPDCLSYWRAVGTGVVDWRGWARRLHEVNYSGWMILELDQARDPVRDLSASREFAENVWLNA
jgi:sugar phosphate isomerase/epimerase